jgi:hypothetical protein
VSTITKELNEDLKKNDLHCLIFSGNAHNDTVRDNGYQHQAYISVSDPVDTENGSFNIENSFEQDPLYAVFNDIKDNLKNHKSAEKISIRRCKISDKTMKLICNEILTDNKSIKKLSFCDLEITYPVMHIFCAGLEKNTSLKKLGLLTVKFNLQASNERTL